MSRSSCLHTCTASVDFIAVPSGQSDAPPVCSDQRSGSYELAPRRHNFAQTLRCHSLRSPRGCPPTHTVEHGPRPQQALTYLWTAAQANISAITAPHPLYLSWFDASVPGCILRLHRWTVAVAGAGSQPHSQTTLTVACTARLRGSAATAAAIRGSWAEQTHRRPRQGFAASFEASAPSRLAAAAASAAAAPLSGPEYGREGPDSVRRRGSFRQLTGRRSRLYQLAAGKSGGNNRVQGLGSHVQPCFGGSPASTRPRRWRRF